MFLIKKARLFFVAVLVFLCTVAAVVCAGGCVWAAVLHKRSILDLAKGVDWQCMHLQVLACPKANPQMLGIRYRYWEPSLIVETVKQPGDYVIAEVGSAITNILKSSVDKTLKAYFKNNQLVADGGDAHSFSGEGGLRFQEAHVYDFPAKMFIDKALCPNPTNTTLGVRYLTEMDSVEWRTTQSEEFLPQSQMAIAIKSNDLGLWGSLFPRSGYVINPSDPIASVLVMMRAVSIAGLPLLKHFVESPTLFMPDTFRDKVQAWHPVAMQCMESGRDPRVGEQNMSNEEGQYVWLYWRWRDCCL